MSLIDEYISEGKIIKTLNEYKKTKSQELFSNIIKHTAGSKNSIDGYNNWVTYTIHKSFKEESFTSPDGVEISFSDIFLDKPKHVVDGKEVPLYPAYARKYKIFYVGKLTGICTAKKNNEEYKTNIFFGNIPIMLGSIKCNLYNKSPEELVRLGECTSDPFGYFILNSERSIITNDKQRTEYHLLNVSKDLSIQLRETYLKKRREILVLSKKLNAIKLVDDRNITEKRKDLKHIPIFIVFKIISGKEPEEIIENYILKFILDEDKEAVRNALEDSVFKYQKYPDIYQYLFKKRKNFYMSKNSKELSKQEIKNLVSQDLENDVYSNYNDIKDKKIRVENKLLSLSYLVSKLLLFMVNKINIDHKDHWKVKRFENPPVLLSTLVSSIFKEVVKRIVTDKNKSDDSDYLTFGQLLNSKSSSKFKNLIENSLNTANWGIPNTGWKAENHAEATRRDTPLALWSQSVKNTNSSSSIGMVIPPRLLQPSQRGRHCIAETPEGPQVGIVKYNTLTGIFSLTRDPSSIYKVLEKYGSLYSESYNILPVINGKNYYSEEKKSFMYVNEEFKDILVEKKKMNEIPYDTEITRSELQNVLQIYTDSSRPICPYLVINKNTGKLVIDEKNGWKAGYEKLIKNGCIEFLSAAEEDKEDIIICKNIEHFYNTMESEEIIYNYSHCSIDPLQVYSVSTSTCPYFNHQPGPRTTFQAAMGKQAIGYYHTNYHLRFPKEFKRLYKADRSLTETDTYFLPQMDYLPCGQITNIAFLSTADNQEDAVVVCEDFINSGKLNIVKYKTYELVVNTSSKSGGVNVFKKPDLKPNENSKIYRHLNENGFPKLDSFIELGDVILGRVIKTPNGDKNESVKADLDMSGYIDRVEIVGDANGKKPIIKIKLRIWRPYIAGDKLALRYAQKGTIGAVVKREDMPVVMDGPNKGMVPDLLFNSIGFPKRQTEGLLQEGLASKAALYNGKRVNCTAFRKFDKEKIQKILIDNGLDPDGTENMMMSDGKRLDNKVFFVPLYEQALRHHVADKRQFRTTGPRDFKTHQPQGGRTKGKALKVGEMEKDAFVAHGASSVIEERMMKSSDEFKLIVCRNCGSIVDDKKCRVCDNSQPGVLLIPYVFKVFIHLLNGINIDIRLRTEKVLNVD